MVNGFSDYEQEPQDGLPEAEPDGKEQPLGAFPNPDTDLSPVTPLGFAGPKVVFAMPEGEIRTELASKIGSMLRTDIYACAAGQSFLATWRDREGKFLRDLATVWFVRRCREAGMWDANRPIRSLGVWPGEGGSVVLHKGDRVYVIAPGAEPKGFTIAEMLKVRRGPLYRLKPPATEPDKPCSVGELGWVREQLDLWRWEEIGAEGLTGADVVFGWLGAAMLGGFAPFRGHVMLDALAGSGKTTLVLLLHDLMSALSGEVIDSFSEAGLRNDLAGMARPVLIDEAEGTPAAAAGHRGPVELALDLLRRMSTGQGGTRKQGDIGGGSVTQTAVGAALLAAINAPKLGPADGTRFVQVRLLPLVRPGENPPRPLASDAEIAALREKARGLAPAILGRALRCAHRYRADVALIKAASGKSGNAPRTADLVAMLAAGRRLLMADEALTPETAEEELAFWQPLLDQRASAEVVSNPGADALAHIMGWDSGQHRNDRRVSIGELVEDWVDGKRDYDRVLKGHGLRLYADQRGEPWMIVANHHPVLEKMFERTKWQDWRRALSYLDAIGPAYETVPTKPQNFGLGITQRGVAVPLTPWLGRSRSQSAGGVTPGVTEDVTGHHHDW